MRKTGIWLDKEKALILTLEKNEEYFETVSSELEFFNPKGGSRSKTRWGPQDVVQDSKYLEREKHQLNRYFENIVRSLGAVGELAIFGPAEAPEKFFKVLKEKHPDMAKKVKTMEKVDSMTENQVKALVRTCFRTKT